MLRLVRALLPLLATTMVGSSGITVDSYRLEADATLMRNEAGVSGVAQSVGQAAILPDSKLEKESKAQEGEKADDKKWVHDPFRARNANRNIFRHANDIELLADEVVGAKTKNNHKHTEAENLAIRNELKMKEKSS